MKCWPRSELISNKILQDQLSAIARPFVVLMGDAVVIVEWQETLLLLRDSFAELLRTEDRLGSGCKTSDSHRHSSYASSSLAGVDIDGLDSRLCLSTLGFHIPDSRGPFHKTRPMPPLVRTLTSYNVAHTLFANGNVFPRASLQSMKAGRRDLSLTLKASMRSSFRQSG